MKLADKSCYPLLAYDVNGNEIPLQEKGLTLRERLVIALAGNPNMVITFQGNDDRFYPELKETTIAIFKIADGIINEMEKK